eukprot:5304125-Prymnesium_polylepis.1
MSRCSSAGILGFLSCSGERRTRSHAVQTAKCTMRAAIVRVPPPYQHGPDLCDECADLIPRALPGQLRARRGEVCVLVDRAQGASIELEEGGAIQHEQ